jgi:hypothetical protein
MPAAGLKTQIQAAEDEQTAGAWVVHLSVSCSFTSSGLEPATFRLVA